MESFERLKACPFCGSKDLKISAQEAQESGDVLFVHCKNCDACGPAFDATPEGSEEAKEAWNQRACRKVSKKDLEMISYSFPWHLLDLLPSNDDQKDYLIRAIIKIWERIKSI